MWGWSWQLESEKTSIRVVNIESLSAINENVFVKDILLKSSHSSSVSKNLFSNQKRNRWSVTGSFKCQNDMDVISFTKISNFTSNVFGSFSFSRWVVEDRCAKFFVDYINKFFMTFNSSCRNDDSSWGEGGCLEFLNDISLKIVDIASWSLDWVTKVSLSESSLMDVIMENLVVSKEGFEFMSIWVLVHTYTGGDKVFGFECAICNHREDIDDIMCETVSSIVAILSIIFHFKLSSCHLSDTIVDSLTGVDGCFKICVFKWKHGSTGLSSFVSAADINEDTHVDVGRNCHWFSKYSDSVVELCRFIFCRLRVEGFGFCAQRGVDRSANESLVAE